MYKGLNCLHVNEWHQCTQRTCGELLKCEANHTLHHCFKKKIKKRCADFAASYLNEPLGCEERSWSHHLDKQIPLGVLLGTYHAVNLSSKVGRKKKQGTVDEKKTIQEI